MARTRNEAIDRSAEKAAFLRSRGMSQEQIANALETTQPNVSRLLKRARVVLGCYRLEVSHRFLEDKVTPERLQQLRGFAAPEGLREAVQRAAERAGVQAPNVCVVERVANETSEAAFRQELARFGRAAAAPAGELLRRASHVGVTWGSTLSALVDGFEAGPRPPAERQVLFFPVCAESEQFAGTRESSSSVASRLNQAFDTTAPGALALTRIPAFIPKRFRGRARDGIEAMIHASPAYRRIYGSVRESPKGQPLIERADALLTSIGNAERPSGFNYEELLNAGEVRSERLSKLIVGDIGGILIRRRSLRPDERRAVDDLNAMWTGLKYDALAAIAERARANEHPGVIVISCGSGRAEILHAVILGGLVNEIVVDGLAADALLAKLKER